MRMSPPECIKVDPKVANSFKKNVLLPEGSRAALLSELSVASIEMVLQGKGFIFLKFCKF